MQSLSRERTESTALPDTIGKKSGGGYWGRFPTVARYAVLVLALLGAWQLYVSLSGTQALILPGPVDVAKAFVEGWADGRLASATLKTLCIGMVIGGLMLAGCTAAGGASGGKKLRVVYQPGTTTYAQLVIMEQEKWLAKDLPDYEVSWTQVDAGAAVRNAIVAGEADVGAGGSDLSWSVTTAGWTGAS